MKLSDETWNQTYYFKLFKLLNLSWRVAYLKLLKLLKTIMEGCLFETLNDIWNEMCYLKLLKLLKPIMEGCLFETFETSQTYHGGLLIWNFQITLEIRRTISNFLNYSTYHGELLIWNFQMRFEMRCAIWNFWNFSNLSWRVTYLKLLKLFKPIMEGCLFETFQTYHGRLFIWIFQMTFEMRCVIWNFWNFSNLSWRVAYLKLSDDTWNEMYYLKLLKLLKPIMEGCLFETFRWDLKWDVLFETFETSQTYHGGLLIWNFQMTLEMTTISTYLKLLRTYHGELLIWNFWNFSNLSCTRVAYLKLLMNLIMEGCLFETFNDIWNEMCYLKLLKLLKPIMEGCLFETFRWHLKWDVLFETFETSQTYHGGLLIWNFQMRLEMRCAIWNFWNFSNLSWRVAYLKLSDDTWNQTYYFKLFKLLNLSWRVAYLKLSDEIWNEMYYLKLLKLLKSIMEGGLFETFETSQTYHGGLLIWNFQMTFEMRCAIWNFWNFSNLSWRVAYLKLSDHTWNQTYYFKLFKLLNLSWRVAYLKLSDEIWNEMCYLKLLKLLKPIMEGCLIETFR